MRFQTPGAGRNCGRRLSNKISVNEILTKNSLSFNKTKKIACGTYSLNLCNIFWTKEWLSSRRFIKSRSSYWVQLVPPVNPQNTSNSLSLYAEYYERHTNSLSFSFSFLSFYFWRDVCPSLDLCFKRYRGNIIKFRNCKMTRWLCNLF